jgi:hypothetical protein
MKEFMFKLKEVAVVVAFVTISVVMVMVACLFGRSVSGALYPTKETVCASGAVYVKESNNYWVKTNKECFTSIPVSKD